MILPAAKGILFSDCTRVHLSVNTMSYKLCVGISPNLQLSCSWGQRWTDYIFRSKVKVIARPDMVKNALQEYECHRFKGQSHRQPFWHRHTGWQLPSRIILFFLVRVVATSTATSSKKAVSFCTILLFYLCCVLYVVYYRCVQ